MDNYEDPLPQKMYVSPSLRAFSDPDRRVRIATKLFDQPVTYAYAIEKGEMTIRHKADAKTIITAKFFEDDRNLFVLNIQGYTVATQRPHNASFSFVGEEIGRLVEFINHIQAMPLDSRGPLRIDDQDLTTMVLSNIQAKSLVRDNHEIFSELMRSEMTKEDIVAVGYRKKQIQVFERLLNDEDYFRNQMAQRNCSPEALWQLFFERNPWIFGYGLSYIALSAITNRKLEQVVSGYSIAGPGKRADALLHTRGIISSLCFVEIKTHKTSLLKSAPYRSGCWAPSDELAGGISQVQTTVAAATESIRSKLEIRDKLGSPTGEEAFNYSPKSFLVIGSLSDFTTKNGVNQDQFRSFEILRRNTVSPEILTFDELYERARFIVGQHET